MGVTETDLIEDEMDIERGQSGNAPDSEAGEKPKREAGENAKLKAEEKEEHDLEEKAMRASRISPAQLLCR